MPILSNPIDRYMHYRPIEILKIDKCVHHGRINSGRGPGATSVVEAPNSCYKCAVKNEI